MIDWAHFALGPPHHLEMEIASSEKSFSFILKGIIS
jgi:hypothetical protein